MEEQEVSIEGREIKLDTPFFVIATQNPLEQSGTFPLPESQLDRFLMRLSLGYPSAEFERQLLLGTNLRGKADAVLSQSDVAQLIDEVQQVHASEAVVDYLQKLISETRTCGKFVTGLSPRAGLQWLQASKALAFVEGRNAVLPDDVKLLANYTAAHRLHCNDGSESLIALAEIIDNIEVL